MPKMKEALVSDAVGTIAGALTGTSTVRSVPSSRVTVVRYISGCRTSK